MNNMEKLFIEGVNGTQLAISINNFSTWILSQSKTVLEGQKNLLCIPEVMPKTIGTVCVML